MTPPTFVLPRAALAGDDVLLDGAEGRHAVTVRRVRAGERVDVTDGDGLRLECVVSELVGRDGARLAVIERLESPPADPRVVVVQAVPKGERGELAVELLTEVGVDEIVPWSAERCVAQWKGERGARSAQRWRRTAVEAGKQVRRSRFPLVHDLASTDGVAALLAAADLALVLHEEATEPLAAAAAPPNGRVVVVVGPEGGLTEGELDAFARAGARAVRLGPTVLRTSTAGVAAVSVLMSRTPRWL